MTDNNSKGAEGNLTPFTLEEFRALCQAFYETGEKRGAQSGCSPGRLQDRGEKRAPTFDNFFDEIIGRKWKVVVTNSPTTEHETIEEESIIDFTINLFSSFISNNSGPNDYERGKLIAYENVIDNLKSLKWKYRTVKPREEKWIRIGSLEDDVEETEQCLWCKVPVVEPPYVGSMCDTDFPGTKEFTHFRRMKNDFFPSY